MISLGDIQNMPALWVLALFGISYKFCFHVQTYRHLGGGVCVYFLKSVRNAISEMYGFLGGVSHFSA